ncbi:MAG: S8 family serine peptidase, partial [Anaerolineales bacterium]|nr:S8 family serine peptidase [Anaerolineales bacterium]
MKHQRLNYLFLTILSPLLLLLTWLSLTSGPTVFAQSTHIPFEPLSKLSASVQEQLQTTPDQSIRFIIYFEPNAELDLDQLPTDELERRTAVVNHLQAVATQSQQAVTAVLEQLQQTELVQSYRSLWIINAIAVEAQPEVLTQLATHPSVSHITLDKIIQQIKPAATITNGLRLLDNSAASANHPGNWGITATQASHVWQGLGVQGEGVTVAIMDTGVEWQHPVLYANYRGRQPDNSVQHAGNWYSAAVPTQTEPVDYVWHGTHVAGTAVGQEGLGVAPGANWIAVSIADPYGYLYESYIHSGFQWLLAPANNPALAPDIVNGSWGSTSTFIGFANDINLLHTAGIIPVFAAGNLGPYTNTVTSPASYPDTIAVGAYDQLDTVTWFSSRGPSELTTQIKPLLVAPGAEIVSAYPEGQYAIAHGTSMASPHVAGTIALMLSADPTLTESDIQQTLIDTAVPFANIASPHIDSGWGKLNAYAAVSQHLTKGILTGVVTGANQPLSAAELTLITAEGNELSFTTGADGRFRMPLQAGTYSLRVAKFSFNTTTFSNLTVTNNQTTTHNINLVQPPLGSYSGQVVNSSGGITATVKLFNTPVMLNTTADGQFNIQLPAGSYEAEIAAKGHKKISQTVNITADMTTNATYNLTQAPSILLIDSGQWYYNSYLNYYQRTLDALAYSYDTWVVHDAYNRFPSLEAMQSYDIVIWSSPQIGPAYLGANAILTSYLNNGGNLFVSGHDVGLYDRFIWSGGTSWWKTHLRAEFLTETNASRPLYGVTDTNYAGLTFSLNGADSANNQINIDVVNRIPQTPFTEPIFTTVIDGQSYPVGLQAGQCDPYNITYLGFGLEGVTNQTNRNLILQKAIDSFARPLVNVEVRWQDEPIQELTLPGQTFTYNLWVRNASEIAADTLSISAASGSWPVQIYTDTTTLESCAIAPIRVQVQVPADFPLDTYHDIVLTAASGRNPAVTDPLTITFKTPASTLIVDDHRWYPERVERFDRILTELGVAHDMWVTYGKLKGRGSPPADLINQYDTILWFTAYDWFQPITPAESQALQAFLEQGGRLFLSSQDYMYYHRSTALTRDYFGIASYQESITPTVVYGTSPLFAPVLTATNPISLSYDPYQNNGDSLIAQPQALPYLSHNQGLAAVANRGPAAAGQSQWRTIFMGLPLEVLDGRVQTTTLQHIVGWLSDLGDSAFMVDAVNAPAAAPRTYTVTLRNNNVQTHLVTMTNQLPDGLTLLPSTVSGGAIYNGTTHQLSWHGSLAPNQTQLITYQAQPEAALPSGTHLENRVTILSDKLEIPIEQTTSTWISAPSFANSQVTLLSNAPRPISNTITATITLLNDGLVAAGATSATIYLPAYTYPLSGTLNSSAGTAVLKDTQIHWTGTIDLHQPITLSLVMTSTQAAASDWLITTLELQESASNRLHVHHYQTAAVPFVSYA